MKKKNKTNLNWIEHKPGKTITENDQNLFCLLTMNHHPIHLDGIFSKKTKCSKNWKIQVYNAVIVSQLTYGLETMYLNDSLLKRLDAFHLRGLRHTMNIEHSYWSRMKNSDIIEKVNKVLNEKVNITEN